MAKKESNNDQPQEQEHSEGSLAERLGGVMGAVAGTVGDAASAVGDRLHVGEVAANVGERVGGVASAVGERLGGVVTAVTNREADGDGDGDTAGDDGAVVAENETIPAAVAVRGPARPGVQLPEYLQNRRSEVGRVVSDKMDKTVVVAVNRSKTHPIYKKVIRQTVKFMAHDEKGAATGDTVRIVESRPMSKRKRWLVVEIVQKAEQL